eukprot:SAG31_NODE_10542_length_1126_cov_1.765336_1_plen_209_part_00
MNTGSAIFLLFEGGQFIWPGVEVGHRRPVLIHDRQMVLETLSLQPLILSIDGLLSDEETSLVISNSVAHMAPSKVTMADHDKGKAHQEFRTSTTYWLHSHTSWLQNIDRRVSNLTRTRLDAQESVQVLRYEATQHYGAHLDYTDRQFYWRDHAHMERQQGTYKNRMATVFWYLSDVTGGPFNRSGATNFPRAGGLPHPRSTRACDSGG